jgi:hypothetical protein
LGACETQWYSEVYDPTPTDWTWTDMGSGEFPAAGYGYVSYIRNPTFRDVLFGPWYPGAGIATFNKKELAETPCYDRTDLMQQSSPWDYVFYFGGPGGDAPGCN